MLNQKPKTMNNKIYIYHTKPEELPYGYRATIALQKIDSGDGYQLGISLCNPSDRFVKKDGLNRAKGRVLANDMDYSTTLEKESRNEIMKDVKLALKDTIYEKHPAKNTINTFFEFLGELQKAEV